jgi:galactose mutarotase-like enzyme
MAEHRLVLTDSAAGSHEADFEKRFGAFGVRRATLQGGVRQGVDTIEIDNGRFRFVVVPTRGMGLWKGWLGQTEIGWQSPVKGPVHPSFVPLPEPSGLGWLEGFDELVCRCGLVSNGAPDFGHTGAWRYPLHGRIANLPAHRVELVVDDALGELSLTGLVDEARFLFQKLRLRATYKTKVGQSGLVIADEVTNLSADPAEMQLLYHVNFGPPLVDPGAKFVGPVKAVVPRDPRAAEGIETWDSYAAEVHHFAEQVYFFELLADGEGRTRVLLKNAHATHGVSLRYSVRQLPHFTLWKSTQMAADGYVTGLEPGTNFPNPRTFEGQHGRVVKLAAGETARFELALDLHEGSESIAAAEREIAALQAVRKPEVFPTPQAGWTRTSSSNT